MAVALRNRSSVNFIRGLEDVFGHYASVTQKISKSFNNPLHRRGFRSNILYYHWPNFIKKSPKSPKKRGKTLKRLWSFGKLFQVCSNQVLSFLGKEEKYKDIGRYFKREWCLNSLLFLISVSLKVFKELYKFSLKV